MYIRARTVHIEQNTIKSLLQYFQQRTSEIDGADNDSGEENGGVEKDGVENDVFICVSIIINPNKAMPNTTEVAMRSIEN